MLGLTNKKLIAVYEEIDADPYWMKHPADGQPIFHTDSNHLVPGRGNDRNPIAFVVGEAPGALEAAQRRTFVGPSGVVLIDLMKLGGLTLANSWVTNVVKYRPPGNRTPNLSEQLHAKPSIQAEWAAVGKPRYIVAVGAVARDVVGTLGQLSTALSLCAGNGYANSVGGLTFAQFHPAYGLRNPKARPHMEGQWERMAESIREHEQWLRDREGEYA